MQIIVMHDILLYELLNNTCQIFGIITKREALNRAYWSRMSPSVVHKYLTCMYRGVARILEKRGQRI